MRKLLTYTLIFLLIGGLFFLFWDDISSFWKKSSIIAAIIAGFFAIKDFIIWIFHFISNKFSNLFKYFLALIASLGVFFLGYDMLPEEGSVKANIKEMKTSVVEFLRLPSRSEEIIDGDVITIPSPSSSESIRTLESGLNSSAEGGRDIIRIYTDSSSDEGVRNNDSSGSVLSEDSTSSVDPLTALLSDDYSTVEVINDIQEPSASIDPLVALLSDNTDSNAKVEEGENTTTLSFVNDSDQNWKTPIIQIINTPNPTETIVIPTESSNPKIIAVNINNDENNTSSSNISLNTSLAESGGTLPSSGNNDDRFTIMFREIPVQVVYPIEYSLSNTIWTDKKNTLDSVSFQIITPQNEKVQMNIDIVNFGDIYDKYVNKFTQSSETKNIFFIEHTSSQSLEYITFFNGNCWKITITLPSENPSLDDFYSILLPAVFEAQE